MAKISRECKDLARDITETASALFNAVAVSPDEGRANLQSLRLERLVEKFREEWER